MTRIILSQKDIHFLPAYSNFSDEFHRDSATLLVGLEITQGKLGERRVQ
jgi:hypothetical protein